MPYIKQADRGRFIDPAKDIATKAECAGDLNYAITAICHFYLKKKGIKYANVNEVIGMLDCCKMELYRKVGAPYEDVKIAENGDVGIILPADLEGKKY
jgi:hypothetical protein